MSTLRDMIETSFAAAAFAERNLEQETLSVLGKTAKNQTKAEAPRADAKNKRQRPSLKV